MRLILVPNAELGTRTPDYRPTIPLGLLSLASALKGKPQIAVHVTDPRSIDFQSPEMTAGKLLDLEPDVVGFSTMCNTYPHALRTAELLKAKRKCLPIVFGGPHASTVASETLETFEFVDFILTSECERSIQDFMAYLSGPGGQPAVPGLMYRHRGNAVSSLPNYPMLPADELPDIDYSLLHHLRDFGSVPLDVGRGCPFGCTFCTTNVYWERRYRLRSVEYVLHAVQDVQTVHGINSFGFVHDNFTAAPPKVAEFCEKVIASGIKFEWRCSARPDSLDGPLLDLMHAAGCRSIFMGIESGSPRVQRLCKKRVKLDHVAPTIKRALNLELSLTASFIVGFPYEEIDDIEKTLEMMSQINYESRTSYELQLHLLAPVPGAPLSSESHVEIALDKSVSDVSAAAGLDSEMWEWIAKYGKPIFESFYHYINSALSREQILRLRHGWFTIFTHLKLTALALEEARRKEEFAMTSLFLEGSLPPTTAGAGEIFEWCVKCVHDFLSSKRGAIWESVLAVLAFEADVHRLRLLGGTKLVRLTHDVYSWAESALNPSSAPVGFPDARPSHYVLVTVDDAVKIAQLPVPNSVTVPSN